MDAIAKATRQSFRMRGRSYVALAFCPVVPIAGWLEEIDVTLTRSPGFFAGKPVVLDLSAVDLSPEAKPKPISLLLESPVRSGQSIFSEGDETVLGSVASGAEIVAGGCISRFWGRSGC